MPPLRRRMVGLRAVRDTNLSSPPSEILTDGYTYCAVRWWYEGPPLVRMVQRARRNAAVRSEEAARMLGLEGFVSRLRAPHDLSDLWAVLA